MRLCTRLCQFRNNSVYGPNFLLIFIRPIDVTYRITFIIKDCMQHTTTLLLCDPLQLGMFRVALFRMRYCNNISNAECAGMNATFVKLFVCILKNGNNRHTRLHLKQNQPASLVWIMILFLKLKISIFYKSVYNILHVN